MKSDRLSKYSKSQMLFEQKEKELTRKSHTNEEMKKINVFRSILSFFKSEVRGNC